MQRSPAQPGGAGLSAPFPEDACIFIAHMVTTWSGTLFLHSGLDRFEIKGVQVAEAETPVLWPPHAKSWLIGKDSDAGRGWGQEEKGTTEDEMAGWHHWLDAHEFGWTPGVGDRQGGLACCDSWGRKESDTTEQMNWTEVQQGWFCSGSKTWSIRGFFFFLPHYAAWKILIPQLGIKPAPL